MIRCIKLRHYQKNTLRAFVDLELPHAGLVLHDCTLHEHSGKKWISFPARYYENDDGNSCWTPVVQFSAGADRGEFQRQALAAIDMFSKQNLPEPAAAREDWS
jgi:hypothetical protein